MRFKKAQYLFCSWLPSFFFISRSLTLLQLSIIRVIDLIFFPILFFCCSHLMHTEKKWVICTAYNTYIMKSFHNIHKLFSLKNNWNFLTHLWFWYDNGTERMSCYAFHRLCDWCSQIVLLIKKKKREKNFLTCKYDKFLLMDD